MLLLAFLCGLVQAARFDNNRRYQLASRATPAPAPIEVPASQDFEGPDGPWSSFVMRIGQPPQTVKVLISTASDQTWAVLPQGCTPKDPSNCEISRGGFFRPDQSHTWVQNNLSINGTFSFGLESDLGYFSNALYGYDTVALGWQGGGGPSLQHQVVAGLATKDFYLGLFGVNPRPSNFTNFDTTFPSFMSSLKSNSLIPSVSYGYTSGNQYRLNKILASLTLGGYDSSRFIPNEVRFPFDQIEDRDLTVTINSIIMTANGTNSSLMSNPIQAFVDSTIPYLYLPLAVCVKFEAAFGLIFNDTVQAYLVNDTLHRQLLDRDASVTFNLGNSINIMKTVDITLPYAAFDLIADYPLMPTPSKYFPLMRATNESQYTLGRTFLQEAYLIADYERFSFTLSQCDWSTASQQPKIVSIKPYSPALPPASNHRVLATTAIVGVAVGGLLAVSLVLAFLYWGYLKIKASLGVHDDSDKIELDHEPPKSKIELDSDPLSAELDSTSRAGPELDGENTQIVEAQDQLCWVPELQGENEVAYMARHQTDDEQDCVVELQGGGELDDDQDGTGKRPSEGQMPSELPG